MKRVLATIFLALPMAANAITLDFATPGALAVSSVDGGAGCGSGDTCGTQLNFDGVGPSIDLDVTGSGPGAPATTWYAWYDLNPANGGIGASSTLGSGSSDNIFPEESVTLKFSEDVKLVSWVSLNHGKSLGTSPLYDLIVDGMTKVDDDSIAAGVAEVVNLTGMEFTFLNVSASSRAT